MEGTSLSKKGSYQSISKEQKQELIQRVLKFKEPVELVATHLGIKVPTAKNYIGRYKKTGSLPVGRKQI